MKRLTFLVLLVTAAGGILHAQTTSKPSTEEIEHLTRLSSELEDVAMCHHAIKSAQYQAQANNQNSYYRFLLMDSLHVYPDADHCKAMEDKWVVNYETLDADGKKFLDRVFTNLGMTLSDTASDATFMSTVTLNKAFGQSHWNSLDSPDAIK